MLLFVICLLVYIPKMFCEKLIVEVEKYPHLYDKDHEFYRHKVRKEKSWNAISKAVGQKVEICQSRWRSLRDRFVKEMCKEPVSQWRFLESLDFLTDHVKSKQLNGNYRSSAQYVIKNDEVTDADAVADENKNFNYEDTLTFLTNEETNISEAIAESDASYEYKKPDDDMSFEKVQIFSSPTRTTFEDSLLSQEETEILAPPKTTATKRTRDYSDVEEHFVSFIDSVKDIIKLKLDSNTQQSQQLHQVQRKKSRNEDFLSMLDGYMLKLNEDQQDELKIEVLNLVYKRSNEMKNISTQFHVEQWHDGTQNLD